MIRKDIHQVLWVDDDIDILTGLEASLYEMDRISLSTAPSLNSATKILSTKKIDLLLFDMVLMEDETHAALDRPSGIQIARLARENNVNLFIAYTVFSQEEVIKEWEDQIDPKELPSDEDFTFNYFEKGSSSVTSICDKVREMLGIHRQQQ